jgi:peptidoglycan/LPS O-acetylase OafA/YrhL
MESATLSYRRDIDGLRAVAVVPVLLFHAGSEFVSGGYVGVDIFFVISGFLITSLLLNDLDNGQFSIARFYERRARRILPALTVVLLSVTAAACATYPPSELAEFGRRLLWTSFFASNFYFWSATDYFAPQAETIELVHMWSLAVEEQFYIFFPLGLWALAIQVKRRWHAPLVAAAIALSLALSIYATSTSPLAAFYLTPFRAWELLLGSLLALRVLPPLPGRLPALASLGGAGLIMVSLLTFSRATAFPGAAALLPCVGAGLIIYAGQTNRVTPVGKLLSTKPFVAIGLISYSLYLWHWPLLVMPSLYLMRPLTSWEAAGALVLATILAFLSWRFVERPFRRHRRAEEKSPPSTRRALVAASGTVLAAAALGALLVGTSGLPGRVSHEVRAIERAAMSAKEVFQRDDAESCINGFENFNDRCAGKEASVVVWGDSHAVQHMPGLRAVAGDRRVVRYGVGGCPPLLGVSFIITPAQDHVNAAPGAWQSARRCAEVNQRTLEAILANEKVELVVLGGAWQFFTEGTKLSTGQGRFAVDGFEGRLGIKESRQAVEAGLERTVSALRSHGINVLLFADVPEFRTHPGQCLSRVIMSGRDSSACRVPWHQLAARLAFSNDLVSRYADDPGVEVILPSDYLCTQRGCPLFVDGQLVYMDGDHITPEASVRLLNSHPLHF